MAEEENQPGTVLPNKLVPRYHPGVDDPSIETLFVNNSSASIGQRDVTILLVQDIPTNDGSVSKPLIRLAFTHAGFMQTMRFLNQYASFFEDVYDGKLPSLDSFDDEIVRTKMKEHGVYVNKSESE